MFPTICAVEIISANLNSTISLVDLGRIRKLNVHTNLLIYVSMYEFFSLNVATKQSFGRLMQKGSIYFCIQYH